MNLILTHNTVYKSTFRCRDKSSILLVSLCLLMFACSTAMCFDHDLSYDHGKNDYFMRAGRAISPNRIDYPLDIMLQPFIFVDKIHPGILRAEFINELIVLSSVNKALSFNKAPPS
jgi:hypothetical protein